MGKVSRPAGVLALLTIAACSLFARPQQPTPPQQSQQTRQSAPPQSQTRPPQIQQQQSVAPPRIEQSAQTQPAPPQSPNDVPVTDAESGPCSVELTVFGDDAKPVYAARIDYRAAYGFMGTHKLDMTVYTNAQGKARFTGIPARVKKPPIEFSAVKDDLFGMATVDPSAECQAKHDIVMDKKKPQ